MRTPLRFLVEDTSAVGEARRSSVELARMLGLGEVRQGEVAIVVTELATNLVKHARGGELLIRAVEDGTLEVLAVDRGGGIARPAEVMRDGYSTAGTLGAGLGAVRRLAARFDLYSTPGAGTVVMARLPAVASTAPPAPFDVGIVRVPYPGETVCGDSVAVATRPDRLNVLVVDGLGHGIGANTAAEAAVAAFTARGSDAPAELLLAVHHGMRGTRGGVAGVASVRLAEGNVLFCGMGNISATVAQGTTRRGLVSQNGTLGLTAPRPLEYSQAWTPDSVLVVHSDGLVSSWNLAAYPGLIRRPAALIAGVLYRDFFRGRDDATVVVVRGAE